MGEAFAQGDREVSLLVFSSAMLVLPKHAEMNSSPLVFTGDKSPILKEAPSPAKMDPPEFLQDSHIRT